MSFIGHKVKKIDKDEFRKDLGNIVRLSGSSTKIGNYA